MTRGYVGIQPGDHVGLLFRKTTLILVGAAMYTFIRKNDLKNVDKSFVTLLTIYFTIKAIQKNYDTDVWLNTGDAPDVFDEISPSFLFKVLFLINAKKINKGTTKIIICKILSSISAYAWKAGIVNSSLGYFIQIALDSYVYYLIPNKNISDVIYFPIKSVISFMELNNVMSTDTRKNINNIIDIAEAFYFIRIIHLD